MGTMAVTMSFCSLVIVDVYIDSEYCDLFSSFNRLLSQMKGVAFGQMLCWPLIRFASRSRQIFNAMWGPVSEWQLSTCFRVADTRHVHSHIYVSTLFFWIFSFFLNYFAIESSEKHYFIFTWPVIGRSHTHKPHNSMNVEMQPDCNLTCLSIWIGIFWNFPLIHSNSRQSAVPSARMLIIRQRIFVLFTFNMQFSLFSRNFQIENVKITRDRNIIWCRFNSNIFRIVQPSRMAWIPRWGWYIPEWGI